MIDWKFSGGLLGSLLMSVNSEVSLICTVLMRCFIL